MTSMFGSLRVTNQCKGGLAMAVQEAAIDVPDRRGNEPLEKRGRAIVEPRVQTKPGRMSKVLQSDDRLETLPATCREPVGIAVENPEIEFGRLRALWVMWTAARAPIRCSAGTH